MAIRSSDIDTVFQSFSHYRRRFVVYYLIRNGHEVVLDDLVRWLVTREGEGGTGVSDDHEQRIALDLHHAHLPKLADAGVIDYDPERGRVRYRGGSLLEDCLRINELMSLELEE